MIYLATISRKYIILYSNSSFCIQTISILHCFVSNSATLEGGGSSNNKATIKIHCSHLHPCVYHYHGDLKLTFVYNIHRLCCCCIKVP